MPIFPCSSTRAASSGRETHTARAEIHVPPRNPASARSFRACSGLKPAVRPARGSWSSRPARNGMPASRAFGKSFLTSRVLSVANANARRTRASVNGGRVTLKSVRNTCRDIRTCGSQARFFSTSSNSAGTRSLSQTMSAIAGFVEIQSCVRRSDRQHVDDSRSRVFRVPVSRIADEADFDRSIARRQVRNAPLTGRGRACSQRSPYFSIVCRGTTASVGNAQTSRKKGSGSVQLHAQPMRIERLNPDLVVL